MTEEISDKEKFSNIDDMLVDAIKNGHMLVITSGQMVEARFVPVDNINLDVNGDGKEQIYKGFGIYETISNAYGWWKDAGNASDFDLIGRSK